MTYFIDDNPEVFWLNLNYNFICSSNNENLLIAVFLIYQDSSSFDKYKADSHILESITNREQISAMRNEFYKQSDKILSLVSATADTLEKELIIFEHLSNNVKYNDELANEITNSAVNRPILQSSYGAIVEKSTVCSGYAKSFQFLMTSLGVECINVYGKSDNELHQWNVIKIEDDYYHVDPTSQKTEFANKSFTLYDYFNLSDEQIKKTHEIIPIINDNTKAQMSYPIPNCTSNNYNFENQFAIKINEKNPNSSAEFESIISKVLKYNLDVLYIKFPDNYSEKNIRAWINGNYNKISVNFPKKSMLSEYYYIIEENNICLIEIIKK